MASIKNLFAIKAKKEESFVDPIKLGKNKNVNPNVVSETELTYYEKGNDDSRNANGSSAAFQACLDHIYHSFKRKCEEDLLQQEKDKEPYKVELSRQQAELQRKETIKEIKRRRQQEIDTEISHLTNEISDVSIHPDRYGIDSNRRPKAQFYFGSIILLILLIYLLVFYSSASFSAFFKQFDSTAIGAAIFDADAIGKAFQAGWQEGLFITTIPFVFMGLGYLIHMFNKEVKNGNIKVIALFTVTFLFDSILAYEIEHKIYIIEKTLTSPDFNISIAIQKPEFWGIIFAGFIVYIIWGLVFDFVMKEWENIDKIKQYIKSLFEKKNRLIDERKSLQVEINFIEQEIPSLVSKIGDLQAKLNGFLFPVKRYMIYHSEYNRGWIMYIASGLALSAERKDELIDNCNKVASEHCERYDVNNIDTTIYKVAV